ncbi:MAG: DegT/DnrJ/EryC1/StrS aminotransferase family protein [Treponema sp.]|nr:DegT/DnrJ/EryC1/StrS aminotransferase family protein [Treponema sp.]
MSKVVDGQQSLDFIPFSVPAIGEEEKAAVLRVMDSGWLTTAKEALAFEQEFAHYVSDFQGGQTPHEIKALAVNSATSGLQLAYHACGVGDDALIDGTGHLGKQFSTPGKILTTPYTFVSTATAACHLGGGVVYADVEADGYNIDPVQVEQKLTQDKDIRAVVPVHIAGLPCNMEEICAVAAKYGVPVVEDAAHAFPSKTKNGYAGTLGDIGVYSFYATKTITTAEGGMVCTKNPEYYKFMSTMRMHGIDRPVWNRYTSEKASWEYDVVAPGYKFNLPDVLAAMGRVQLQKADVLFQQRKAIAHQYNQAFADCDFLQLPPDGDGNAWHLYILRVVPEKLKLTRNEFTQKLQEAGLGISMHFIPHFRLSYLRNRFDLHSEDYPNAQKRFETSFSLPFWPGMSQEMVERVIDTVVTLGRKYYGN